jgi:hypothetical protein
VGNGGMFHSSRARWQVLRQVSSASHAICVGRSETIPISPASPRRSAVSEVGRRRGGPTPTMTLLCGRLPPAPRGVPVNFSTTPPTSRGPSEMQPATSMIPHLPQAAYCQRRSWSRRNDRAALLAPIRKVACALLVQGCVAFRARGAMAARRQATSAPCYTLRQASSLCPVSGLTDCPSISGPCCSLLTPAPTLLRIDQLTLV